MEKITYSKRSTSLSSSTSTANTQRNGNGTLVLSSERNSWSKLVILPINNTLVSSGQSAGLQAAAVGTTVVTTKTIGFWDYESYEDGKNILFVTNNELKNWTSIVREAYENENLLLTIGKNSKNLVNDIYHLDVFNTKLESFLEFEDTLGSLDD